MRKLLVKFDERFPDVSVCPDDVHHGWDYEDGAIEVSERQLQKIYQVMRDYDDLVYWIRKRVPFHDMNHSDPSAPFPFKNY